VLALLRYSEPSRHTGGTHRVADSALQDCTRCCRLIANSSTKISSHSPACAFNEPTTKALTCRGCCTHTHAATALRRVAPPHASPPPPPLTAHSFTHAPADAPAAAISRGTTTSLPHTPRCRPAAHRALPHASSTRSRCCHLARHNLVSPLCPNPPRTAQALVYSSPA